MHIWFQNCQKGVSEKKKDPVQHSKVDSPILQPKITKYSRKNTAKQMQYRKANTHQIQVTTTIALKKGKRSQMWSYWSFASRTHHCRVSFEKTGRYQGYTSKRLHNWTLFKVPLVTLLKCAEKLGHTFRPTLYNAKNGLAEASLNSNARSYNPSAREKIHFTKLRKREFHNFTPILHCHTWSPWTDLHWRKKNLAAVKKQGGLRTHIIRK